MLKIDGHDNAIIGPTMVWRNDGLFEALVYDAEKIRENLMNYGMTSEGAREYIEFNIEGAYMGDHTPILVWTQDEWSTE
jgi:hypothetical protein